MHRILSRHDFGSRRRPPPAGALAHGRPRGAWLPPRARDRIHKQHEAPDRAADPAAGPEHRAGRGPAQLHRELRAHVDLSQADRLHPEVDRRHRRQGEEKRRARHPLRARAGRAARDEEGGRRARPGADRAGQGGGGGGQGQRRGGRGAPRRGRGDPRQVPGRGRPLGHGGQAARRARSPGSWSIAQVLFESTNQLKSSIAALDKAKATIKRAKAELLARGPGSKRPRWTSGSPKPP